MGGLPRAAGSRIRHARRHTSYGHGHAIPTLVGTLWLGQERGRRTLQSLQPTAHLRAEGAAEAGGSVHAGPKHGYVSTDDSAVLREQGYGGVGTGAVGGLKPDVYLANDVSVNTGSLALCG